LATNRAELWKGRRDAAPVALDRRAKCHYGSPTFPEGRLSASARRMKLVRVEGVAGKRLKVS
jgi:hypothetical protein